MSAPWVSRKPQACFFGWVSGGHLHEVPVALANHLRGGEVVEEGRPGAEQHLLLLRRVRQLLLLVVERRFCGSAPAGRAGRWRSAGAPPDPASPGPRRPRRPSHRRWWGPPRARAGAWGAGAGAGGRGASERELGQQQGGGEHQVSRKSGNRGAIYLGRARARLPAWPGGGRAVPLWVVRSARHPQIQGKRPDRRPGQKGRRHDGLRTGGGPGALHPHAPGRRGLPGVARAAREGRRGQGGHPWTSSTSSSACRARSTSPRSR